MFSKISIAVSALAQGAMCLQAFSAGHKRKSPIAAGHKRKSSSPCSSPSDPPKFSLSVQRWKSADRIKQLEQIDILKLDELLKKDFACDFSPLSTTSGSLSPDERGSLTFLELMRSIEGEASQNKKRKKHDQEKEPEQANITDSTNQIFPIGSVSSLPDLSLTGDFENFELVDAADPEAFAPMSFDLERQN